MIERLLFKKIEVWILGLFLVFMLIAAMLFGSAVLHTAKGGRVAGVIGDIAVEIAGFPIWANRARRAMFTDNQVVPFEGQTGFVKTADIDESGYLLLSAYDADHGSSVVRLVELNSGEVIHSWRPNPKEIMSSAQMQDSDFDPITLRHDFRSQAPLLLSDGNIIINSGEGHLARIGVCGRTAWSIGRHFHHSIERTPEGHIIAIIVSPNDLDVPMRNDGYAIVSLDGKILQEKGVMNILTENGLRHIVLGRFTGADVIHLNDAEMILESDSWVKKGDIVFSSRHLSSVFLYRPSTSSIIWYKSGPWLAQHDIDYLGDGRFSLVGNDHSLVDPPEDYFPYEHSSIRSYEPGTGAIETTFDEFMSAIKMNSQGVHRILRNGDLFLDDSDAGVLYRVGRETGKELWRYTWPAGSGIGLMHWARYLYPDEVDLSWLEKADCAA